MADTFNVFEWGGSGTYDSASDNSVFGAESSIRTGGFSDFIFSNARL